MSPHVEPMTPALRAGILARAGEISITFVLQAAVLFLTAGTLAWGWAWLYLGVYLATVGINATVLLRTSPATIAGRSRPSLSGVTAIAPHDQPIDTSALAAPT